MACRGVKKFKKSCELISDRHLFMKGGKIWRRLKGRREIVCSSSLRRLIGKLNQLLISTWSCERAFCQHFLLSVLILKASPGERERETAGKAESRKDGSVRRQKRPWPSSWFHLSTWKRERRSDTGWRILDWREGARLVLGGAEIVVESAERRI